MAISDITVLEQSSTNGRGARKYNVAPGATVINPGEPVARALGATSVTACVTSAGQVGTDYIVGIAQTASNNTASLAGTVEVLPLSSQTTYLIKPKTATSWDTQAEYDNLVGKRMTIDLTASSYTLNASDAAGNACIVQALDVGSYPGRVAIAFRAAVSDLS